MCGVMDTCMTAFLGAGALNLFTRGEIFHDLVGIDREMAPLYTFLGLIAAGGSYAAKEIFFSDDYSGNSHYGGNEEEYPEGYDWRDFPLDKR